jgi:hypothetical protein
MPLVSATFLLAGLQTIPSLYNSKLHTDIYAHAEGLLNKSLLQTPHPSDNLLALLLFSRWNLVPESKKTYIDSWLLSSIALMHAMLSGNSRDHTLSQDGNEQVVGFVGSAGRVWRLLYLTHLQ